VSVLADIRADSWNLPLFLHVLGAMILVGATLTSASLLAFARGDARLLRLGYWTLLAVGLPSFVLMRAGKGAGLLMTTLVLSLVLLAAYVVAAWAMSAKPG
jgi:hypothetical protein